MISIVGKEHDLGGGLTVHRILPQRVKRTVGPFVFLDHMGPLTAGPEQNIDVRPHPHIGLSTLTYLFDRRITHRDSIGSIQDIEPGEGFGYRSPVRTTSPLIFASFEAKRDHELNLHSPGFELGIYMVSGSGEFAGAPLSTHGLLAFDADAAAKIKIREGSRFVVIGGEPLKTPRTVWWNLVSSSREKIETAKQQWREGSFPMVPGETEFIPLPEY